MATDNNLKLVFEFDATQAKANLGALKTVSQSVSNAFTAMQGTATGAQAQTGNLANSIQKAHAASTNLGGSAKLASNATAALATAAAASANQSSALARALNGTQSAVAAFNGAVTNAWHGLQKMNSGLNVSSQSLIRFNAVIRAVRNTEFLARQIAGAAEFAVKCAELSAELTNLEQRVPVQRLEMMQKATEGTVDKMTLMRFALKATSGEIKLTDAGLEVVTRAAENLHKKGFGPTTDIMEKMFSSIERGTTRSLKNFGIALKDCKDKNETLNQTMLELSKIADEHPPMDAALVRVEQMRAKWADFVTDVKTGIGEVVLVVGEAVAEFLEMLGLMSQPQREKDKEYLKKQAKARADREFPVGGDPAADDYLIAKMDTAAYTKAREAAEYEYYNNSLNMLNREDARLKADEQKRIQSLKDKVKLYGEGFHGGDKKDSGVMKPLRAVSYGEPKDGAHKAKYDWLKYLMYDLRDEKWRLPGADDETLGQSNYTLTTGVQRYLGEAEGGRNPLSLALPGFIEGGFNEHPWDSKLTYDPMLTARTLMGKGGFGLTLPNGGYEPRFKDIPENRYEINDKNLAGGKAGAFKDMADLGKLQKFSEDIEKQTTVVGGAFATLSAGISASVEAAITGSDNVGKAFLKASSAALKGIAIESTVRALYNTAMGFAALATGPINGESAAFYFKAAAVFGATALAAGVGSAALGALGGGSTPNVGTRNGGGLIGNANQNNQGPQIITVNVTGAVTAGDYVKLSETIQRSVQLGQMAGRSRSEGNVTVTYE